MWKKTEETRSMIEYNRIGGSSYAPSRILIFKWIDKWAVNVFNETSYFKTKSAALSYAKRWMKAHPNG